MRTLCRKLIVAYLSHHAKGLIRRSGAKVVGITGSVGKTTVKDAVVHILSSSYTVKAAKGGYNTEIGLPLMLLDLESPGSSVTGWIGVLWQAMVRARKQPRWEVIVMEMGVDAPGDMDVLLSLVVPDIAIWTEVTKVHTADGQFADEYAIAEEKGKILTAVTEKGTVIYNTDNQWIREFVAQHTMGATQVWGYGGSEDALFSIAGAKSTEQGIEWQLTGPHGQTSHTAPLVGSFRSSILTPAMLAGYACGIPIEQMHWEGFHASKGRLTTLPGKNESVILDASYNSNLLSTKASLDTLAEMPASRRIALLGQMNELGMYSEAEHRALGAYVAEKEIDMLCCIYGDSRHAREAAIEAGMAPSKVLYFAESEDAGCYVAALLEKGDVVLCQGSQNNVRTERAVKLLMAHPEQAKELLVRQTGIWEEA